MHVWFGDLTVAAVPGPKADHWHVHGHVEGEPHTCDLEFLLLWLLQGLCRFTGRDMATMKKDLTRDLYLTAPEAVEYGLIDKVSRHTCRAAVKMMWTQPNWNWIVLGHCAMMSVPYMCELLHTPLQFLVLARLTREHGPCSHSAQDMLGLWL